MSPRPKSQCTRSHLETKLVVCHGQARKAVIDLFPGALHVMGPINQSKVICHISTTSNQQLTARETRTGVIFTICTICTFEASSRDCGTELNEPHIAIVRKRTKKKEGSTVRLACLDACMRRYLRRGKWNDVKGGLCESLANVLEKTKI